MREQFEVEKAKRLEAEERVKEVLREKKQIIRTYESSTSWRATAPLRWTVRKMNGKKGR